MLAETIEKVDPRRGVLKSEICDGELLHFVGKTYECRAILSPEETGGFSIHASRLPGVVSQGETEEEALHNIAEAFQGVLKSYIDAGQEIPWGDVEIDCPKGSKERWILVDV